MYICAFLRLRFAIANTFTVLNLVSGLKKLNIRSIYPNHSNYENIDVQQSSHPFVLDKKSCTELALVRAANSVYFSFSYLSL